MYKYNSIILELIRICLQNNPLNEFEAFKENFVRAINRGNICYLPLNLLICRQSFHYG